MKSVQVIYKKLWTHIYESCETTTIVKFHVVFSN